MEFIKFVFTVFDVGISKLLANLDKAPAWLQPILLVPLMLPILILSMWAESKGYSSDDVL